MPIQIQGGPAINVVVDSSGQRVEGGAAIPVAVVTDGRAVTGNKATRVVVVTNPDKVEGGAAIPVVAGNAGDPVEGGPAMRVYVVSGSFASPVLLNSLIASWDMTDSSNIGRDFHTSGINATITGATYDGTEQAAKFVAASTQYMSIADRAEIALLNQDWTWEFWIKRTAGSGAFGAPVSKWPYEYALMYGSGGTVTCSLSEAEGVSRDQTATISDNTWYQVIIRYNATTNIRSIQVNTTSAQGTPSTASYALGIWRKSNALVFGALQTSAQYWNGFIKRARLWKRTLTDAEVTLLWNNGSGQPYSALAGLQPATTSVAGNGQDTPSAPSAGTPGKVTYDGDSLTSGTGSTAGNDYPSQCTTLLGASYVKQLNAGVVGQQSTACYNDVGSQIDAQYDATRRSIVALWIGSNDIANATALATLQSNIALYGQWRRNVGFKMVILTILSRNEFALDATKEANHRAFNTWLLANAVSLGYADAVVNLSSDVRLDDGTASLPAAVDSGDHIHLNDTGYGYVATLVKNAIVALG